MYHVFTTEFSVEVTVLNFCDKVKILTIILIVIIYDCQTFSATIDPFLFTMK